MARCRDGDPAPSERCDAGRYGRPVDPDRVLDGVGGNPQGAALVCGTDDEEVRSRVVPEQRLRGGEGGERVELGSPVSTRVTSSFAATELTAGSYTMPPVDVSLVDATAMVAEGSP